MLKRLFVFGAAIASAGAAIGFVKARAQFRTWGIDPIEAARPLPGDAIVPTAEAVDTRGIDIAAPPEKVWPWLVQMGYGRAGWYSYDDLDMNRPSADRIIPELQELKVGDIVPTHPGGGFEVREIKNKHFLVLYADRALVDAQAATTQEGAGLEAASANVRVTGRYLDAAMRGEFHASWAFVLEPLPGGRTRLIERFRGRMEVPPEAEGVAGPPAIAARALLFGLFVMVRRQLLGIRDRVEGRPIQHDPWRAIKLAARQKAMQARTASLEPVSPEVTPA